MPGSSRESQVDLSVTPYYHCISRCVRRAFLCGADDYTGKNYDHRKAWFIERLKVLAEVFAIDVCAYAVMSNHFHSVLRVALERAMKLSDEAVLRRYGRIFPGVAAAVRNLEGKAQKKQVEVLRDRLTDISWFMRCLNEHVARRANKEDKCTGRFWEGRFKSQALLDEGAVLTCMSYVDLNPVRAGMAKTLESSDFTAIQQRLREASGKPEAAGKPASGKRVATKRAGKKLPSVPLAPFQRERSGTREPLPIRLDDYRELLEWTGRLARRSKSGVVVRGKLSGPPAILTTLRIDADAWLQTMTMGGLATGESFGSADAMEALAQSQGKRWLKGRVAAARLFRSAA